MIRWALAGALVVFAFALQAQNTKGDRPQQNQRQVRETRSKSIVKKERGRTKDISGRRLRTKNKSSASRANASYPQVSPYRGRKRVNNDVPAGPRQRVYTSRPRERQRAWSGDISGKPVKRVQPRKTEAARNNVYSQRGPWVNNPSARPREMRTFRTAGKTASGKPIVRRTPKQEQRAWRGSLKGGPVVVRSATGKTKNVFSQRGPYSAVGRFRQPSGRSKQYWNRGILSRLISSPAQRISGPRYPASVSGRARVTPGRKNVYWGKIQRKERAVTTDLAGRPLRARNFRSAAPGLISQDTLRDFRRKPKVTRLRWNQRGGVVSATRGGRAWKGDIAGRPIRTRPPKAREHVGKDLVALTPGAGSWFVGRGIKKLKGRKPITGGGSVSSRRRDNQGQPVDVNRAGSGTIRGAQFSGRTKSGRPMKGGGSVSGRLWNNGNQPVDVNTAGAGTIRGSRFSGSMKAGRPLKGGGSVSGRLWNNRNQPIDVNTAGTGAIRGSQFSGRIKAGRPVKGGGSVSGRLWNNGNQPIDVNTAGTGTIRGSRFSGSMKASRPLKGGGSVSGRLWNNRNQPIDVNTAGMGTIRGARFSGNTKAVRPSKGGGSISARPRNNGNQPVDVNRAGRGTIQGSQYRGKIDINKLWDFEDQGGEFTGFIKAKKPKKGGGSVSGRLWNNDEKPLDPRLPTSNEAKMAGYSGLLRVKRGYKQNPRAHELSVMKRKPTDQTRDADELQVRLRERKTGKKEVDVAGALPGIVPSKEMRRAYSFTGDVRQKDYRKNPSAADQARPVVSPSGAFRKAATEVRGTRMTWNYRRSPSANENALKTIAPTRQWNQASDFGGRMKQRFPYRHNPNSHQLALDVRYYGKAYAKIENYKGEMKVKRYRDGRLHPDARFAHGRPTSQPENRSFFTNVKLWWAKNFRRSETQPDHLKEKVKKPRYDKREIGLWYD